MNHTLDLYVYSKFVSDAVERTNSPPLSMSFKVGRRPFVVRRTPEALAIRKQKHLNTNV